jgi:hypothetical protein
MTRDVMKEKILAILVQDFEFKEPKLDDNLRDVHGLTVSTPSNCSARLNSSSVSPDRERRKRLLKSGQSTIFSIIFKRFTRAAPDNPCHCCR